MTISEDPISSSEEITEETSTNEIWKRVQGIIRPETLVANKMKIQIANEEIEDPIRLAEEFKGLTTNDQIHKKSHGEINSRISRGANT